MAGRRWTAVLLGLVLVASGLGVASAAPDDTAAQARAARTTRLTLVTSADEADHGSTITLSGRLTSGRSGLKGQKVVIRHRVNGTKRWTKVATVTTRRKGAWRRKVTVRVRGQFMATYRGTPATAASRSPARTVDVFAFLTDYAVTPGGRDAYRDEPWTFAGRTAPELVGAPVTLVRGPDRAPSTVATGTVGPGGAISLTHRMSLVGQVDYWLSVPASRLMYGADSPHSTIRTRTEGAPTPPTITTAALPTTEVHVPYRADLAGGGGELTWSALSGLPPGLDLSADGVVTGTPSQAGAWQVGVRASNAAGTATRTVSLTVSPGSLTVTTWPLEDGAVGVAYPEGSFTSFGEQEMTCTPCEGTPRWSVTAGSLPPGLAMEYDEDLLEETYVFGTPTQAGLYTFTATAVLDGRSGSKQFSIRVLPSADQLLRIDYDRTGEAVPPGVLGQPYSHQFTAGAATGLTWSSLGAMPPGLTLSPSGVLSGTPTASGHGWIFVAVTDGTRYDWQGFAMAVAPAS